MRRAMKILAGVALLTAVMPLAALAADPPNLVGIWKVTDDRASLRIGTSPNAPPETAVAVGKGWVLDIKEQKGRTFHGTASGPVGTPINLIGAFRADGKRFLLSTDNGNGDGEMVGGNFELCWSDTLPNLAVVDCAIYAK